MRRITALVAAIIIMIVVPSAVYFLILERPVKALPDEVVLSANDLPGWALTDYDHGGPWPGGTWGITAQYHNSTVHVGNNLSMIVWSFNSSGLARDEYILFTNGDNVTWVELGDDGAIYFQRMIEEDPNGSYHSGDSTYRLTQVATVYVIREANILALVIFETDGFSLDPDGVYREPWMDGIVQLQADRIRQNDIPIHFIAF